MSSRCVILSNGQGNDKLLMKNGSGSRSGILHGAAGPKEVTRMPPFLLTWRNEEEENFDTELQTGSSEEPEETAGKETGEFV